ncbi:PilN domain-containing protein [Roseateles saccharophilus]|uniref:Fimbrial assembly protein PilN n=1 Tax=Roseateles saccharophilus TaxID=304 RepID=A0A4V6P2N4_ROSSA|nr:PilN domain-containing protein [Roseateles saccharophilus]MDG0833070.1 hypothetical protein [Roseateles saccharophilus]TCU96269.1 fimbrial assembly protein PilN [Roseateles saccharophilus]
MSRSRTERLLLAGDRVLDTQGQAWPDFAAWCAAHAGARAELLVGAEQAHSLLVPADLPLADADALQGYARLQFTHYFGPAAQQWPLASSERVACALADADLAALQATAAAQRVRIASLRPSWTLCAAQDGDTAVIDGDMLTWLRRSGGRLVDLQQRHVSDELLRELEGARIAPAIDLLTEPGARLGPDFIAQPSRMRPLAWAWAAAAAAACVLVVLQAQGQREEAQRLAEQSAVLDRLARPAAAAKPKPPNPAARARAWAVSNQLGTDWAALWADVERALPPGLQLAALDLDRQSLRLEGQAADADAVTRLVDRLTLQAAPGDEVVLTRLQKPDTVADETGGALRFELVRRAGGAR